MLLLNVGYNLLETSYHKIVGCVFGEILDAVCPDFSKAFDNIFHSILLEKLGDHCLDGCTVLQAENWLDGQPQRVAMSYILLTASHKQWHPELCQ